MAHSCFSDIIHGQHKPWCQTLIHEVCSCSGIHLIKLFNLPLGVCTHKSTFNVEQVVNQYHGLPACVLSVLEQISNVNTLRCRTWPGLQPTSRGNDCFFLGGGGVWCLIGFILRWSHLNHVYPSFCPACFDGPPSIVHLSPGPNISPTLCC